MRSLKTWRTTGLSYPLGELLLPTPARRREGITGHALHLMICCRVSCCPCHHAARNVARTLFEQCKSCHALVSPSSFRVYGACAACIRSARD